MLLRHPSRLRVFCLLNPIYRIQPKTAAHHLASFATSAPSVPAHKTKIYGWIRSFRHHKNISFLNISDGLKPINLQVVVDKEIRGNVTELKYGAAVEASGRFVTSPAAKQEVEFQADCLRVLGPNNAETYPFAVNTRSYSPNYNRQYLHLRSKLPEFAALLRLRSYCKKLIHDYFHKNNFIQIDTPILTSNDCEGAGKLFSVSSLDNAYPYFGNQAVNLTVSGQLHLEACNSGI